MRLIANFYEITKFSILDKILPEEDKVERLASKFQAPVLILCVTTTLILSVYVCKLFYSPLAVYISIVMVSIARPVTIASVYTYVRIR